MKPILILFLFVLPLIMAATIPNVKEATEEGIEKRMSVNDIVSLLRSLNLDDGCINVCEQHTYGFWHRFCSTACAIVLG